MTLLTLLIQLTLLTLLTLSRSMINTVDTVDTDDTVDTVDQLDDPNHHLKINIPILKEKNLNHFGCFGNSCPSDCILSITQESILSIAAQIFCQHS